MSRETFLSKLFSRETWGLRPKPRMSDEDLIREHWKLMADIMLEAIDKEIERLKKERNGG